MISKSAFMKRLLEEGGQREAPPPVTALAVTTRDRIPQLQRCLAGFIEASEKHGRRMDYLVVDDSRNEKQGEEMRGTSPDSPPVARRSSMRGRKKKLASRMS
jgi:hypothetical protein